MEALYGFIFPFVPALPIKDSRICPMGCDPLELCFRKADANIRVTVRRQEEHHVGQ